MYNKTVTMQQDCFVIQSLIKQSLRITTDLNHHQNYHVYTYPLHLSVALVTRSHNGTQSTIFFCYTTGHPSLVHGNCGHGHKDFPETPTQDMRVSPTYFRREPFVPKR